MEITVVVRFTDHPEINPADYKQQCVESFKMDLLEQVGVKYIRVRKSEIEKVGA